MHLDDVPLPRTPLGLTNEHRGADREGQRDVEGNQHYGKRRAQPCSFESAQIHREIDIGFIQNSDVVVKVSKQPLLPEEVAIEAHKTSTGTKPM